jgi:hypothetical protein
MREFLKGLLLALGVGLLLMEGFVFPAQAGMRKTIAWRHDKDELFITSYARIPITFRCTWEGPDGWMGRTRGSLDPGETKAAYTIFGEDAHAFDCRRTDR